MRRHARGGVVGSECTGVSVEFSQVFCMFQNCHNKARVRAGGYSVMCVKSPAETLIHLLYFPAESGEQKSLKYSLKNTFHLCRANTCLQEWGRRGPADLGTVMSNAASLCHPRFVPGSLGVPPHVCSRCRRCLLPSTCSAVCERGVSSRTLSSKCPSSRETDS